MTVYFANANTVLMKPLTTSPKKIIFSLLFFLTAVVALLGLVLPALMYALTVMVLLFAVAIHDVTQKKKAVLRNFPIIGHLRYFFEEIRPEIQQYFVESNQSGRPINRETRSLVYQRAKGQLQTLPFGTQLDVEAEGYEWIVHSMFPKHVDPKTLRVIVGGADCRQPYQASIFNISAMSYGALSATAIEALNHGAKIGGFAHNTGEGGVSSYHLKPGGDLVWQIGTGYFGCRKDDGSFCEQSFAKRCELPTIRMIELKISQGAKPSHGGILPGVKVTDEIAEIRLVKKGVDVNSPPDHSAFEGPKGLLLFIKRLRELSGGKPVGFKLCLGIRKEFEDICEAMLETGIKPDFITVDGSEGGTGAAPLEFSNNLGTPLKVGLSFVHNTLRKYDLRSEIRIIASGKAFTAFNMITIMALGADMINSARGMMLALGCIQALRCNTNKCPVGVSTTNPSLYQGLDVNDKSMRVANYHRETLVAFSELLGAMGLSHPQELQRHHIQRRITPTEVRDYEQIYG